MGAYPTDQNSHKIPLIPRVHAGASPQPYEPGGSDTWEAPGSGEFNAFYDKDLRVRQLDIGGRPTNSPCPAVRVTYKAG